MLTWTFDTTSGQLVSYFNATQVDTFTSTDPSFAMGDSSSPVGGIGIKGDNGIYIPQGVNLDEIWVYGSALTADQVVTLRDQNGFGPPPLPGDVDLDGDVDMDDFTPIRDNFRKSVTTRQQGDLVRNNTVDFDDFRQWKMAFLGGGGSLAGVDLGFAGNVPEPATGMLLLLATGMLTGRRLRDRSRELFGRPFTAVIAQAIIGPAFTQDVSHPTVTLQVNRMSRIHRRTFLQQSAALARSSLFRRSAHRTSTRSSTSVSSALVGAATSS